MHVIYERVTMLSTDVHFFFLSASNGQLTFEGVPGKKP